MCGLAARYCSYDVVCDTSRFAILIDLESGDIHSINTKKTTYILRDEWI